MTRTRSNPSTLMLAITALVASMAAQRALAQEGGAGAPEGAASAAAADAKSGRTDKEEKDLTQVQQVVVTGNVRREGMLKKEAGYSITTADAEQIKDAAATSTADLLKIVPGVFVETTGGQAGANIRVRGFPEAGDSPYATIQMNGSPIYAAPSLSFLEGSSLFRIDDTVERVEVLRGGTSPIYGSGQPGVSVNFVQRKGTEDPEGDIRLTPGTGELRRVDGYYSGKLAEKWYVTVGGFYGTIVGQRNTEFPSDSGGQVSALITHKLDNGGELGLYARSMNVSSAWYTDVPVIGSVDGKTVTAYPGVDPRTFTWYDEETRSATIETSPGSTPGTKTIDMSRGRGPQLTTFGATLDQKVGDWALNSKANYTSGSVPTYGLVNGGTPVTLGAYIASQVAAANGDPNVVAAAGLATGGTASYSSNGAAIGDTGRMVALVGPWSVDKQIQSFTDETHASKEIFKGNTLTLGGYFADYSSHDLWYLGNQELLTLDARPRLVDVKLNNGVLASRNGMASSAFNFDLDARWSGRNVALYVADEWKVLDALRVDAGVRYENEKIDGTIQNMSTGDLDGNPLTMYDNNLAYFDGSHSTKSWSGSSPSWTLGANYDISKSYSTFVRVNNGVHFPMFDDVRSGLFGSGMEKIQQYEVGFNAVTSLYTAFLSIYTNRLKNSQSQAFQIGAGSTSFQATTQSTGLEFEATVRPLKNFDIGFSGDFARGRYVDSGNITSNKVARVPGTEIRVTPVYRIPTGFGTLRLLATYTHVGQRYSDAENLQPLPAYDTIDLGATASLSTGLDLRLSVTNVTNTLGLTEGNPRVAGSGQNATSGAVMARPLFGRAYQASIGYTF
jgi:iron complex outermembrane receptor protein